MPSSNALATYAVRTISGVAGVATDQILVGEIPEELPLVTFLSLRPMVGSSFPCFRWNYKCRNCFPASTIGTATVVGAAVTFQRNAGGYDSYIYGVSSAELPLLEVDNTKSVLVESVTTYVDNHGNLRVKKEILVAMSGISTGNTPLYDADPFT